jgi:hypothetical protein
MVSVIVVSAMSWSCSMSIMPMIVMSASASTDLMELDTVMRVFFFTVKPYISEIVPDREDRRTHDVREEDLIEHEEYPEWDNRILPCDHPTIEY